MGVSFIFFPCSDLKPTYKTLLSYAPKSPAEEADKQIAAFYFSHCKDLLLRSNQTIHVTCSAFVVNSERTKVLLIYHKKYDSWSWLGGHADGNNDLLQTAIREVQEEAGCHAFAIEKAPISLEILPVAAHFRHNKYIKEHQHLNFTFLLQSDVMTPLLPQSQEADKAQWFPLEQVPSVCSEDHMRPIYRKLIRIVKTQFTDSAD